MDSQDTEKTDDLVVSETPEDVAVLYSWANLHGAKYRDFSASRREYRAKLRHHAAQQVREQALLAQAEAEAAADAADSAERRAVAAARHYQADESDSAAQRALREADEAARTAAAERVEAARRAEAAAVAEAAARREEREIAEAHASAQRQAARYADSEMRRKAAGGVQQVPRELPGRISDPYTVASTSQPLVNSQPLLRPTTGPAAMDQTAPSDELRPSGGPDRHEYRPYTTTPGSPERRTSGGHQGSSRRPQGYHPDDASGVRQIYRGPDLAAARAEYTSTSSSRHSIPAEGRAVAVSAASQGIRPLVERSVPAPRPPSNVNESQATLMDQRHSDPQLHAAGSSQTAPVTASTSATGGQWPPSSGDHSLPVDASHDSNLEV